MGVVELIRSLSDKNTVEKDLTDAMLLVSSMFHERYIRSLKQEIHERCEACHQNPSKELSLIKSIKPFLRKEQHIMHANRAIELVNKFDAAKGIHKEVTQQNRHGHGHYECDDYAYKTGYRHGHERHGHGHDHGCCHDVYEVDERCRCKKKIGKISLLALGAYLFFK